MNTGEQGQRRRGRAVEGRPWLPSRARRWVLLVCISLLGGLYAASRSPAFVEEIHARRVAPAVAVAVGRLSALLPFSLAEALIAGLVLLLVFRFLRGGFLVVRRRERLLALLVSGWWRLLTGVLVVATLFYLFWGVLYARAPLPRRAGWERLERMRPAAGDLEELEGLARDLVQRCNALRRRLAARGAGGDLETLVPDDLDRLLDRAASRVAREVGEGDGFSGWRAPAKLLTASSLAAALGLSGFYSPWTGEANYNRLVPAWQRLHAIAHEKAHQRGVTSEDEAGFVGFLLCVRAGDDLLAYAGWLFAQRQLLRQVARLDPEGARDLIAARDPLVQADVDRARAFWSSHRGWAMRAGTTVNDRFLRLNRVSGGIRSYGMAARLLLLYARAKGGAFPR